MLKVYKLQQNNSSEAVSERDKERERKKERKKERKRDICGI